MSPTVTHLGDLSTGDMQLNCMQCLGKPRDVSINALVPGGLWLVFVTAHQQTTPTASPANKPLEQTYNSNTGKQQFNNKNTRQEQ